MLNPLSRKRLAYTGLVAAAVLTNHLLTTTALADEQASTLPNTSLVTTPVTTTVEQGVYPVLAETSVPEANLTTEIGASSVATSDASSQSSTVIPEPAGEADSSSEESIKAPNPTITIGNQVIAVSYDKPEVAPVIQSNQPDRIVATLTANPATEAAFNWYTKDALAGARVEVSESADMAGARSVTAQAIPTETTYVERTVDGAIIYHVEDLYKDGTNVEAYFTDKAILESNRVWTSGKTYGYEILQPVSETINRTIVTGLKPNTTYYYTVGTAELTSPVGSFTTASLTQDAFKFIHYTDTQNGIWNEHVRNEAEFGARTLNEAIRTAGDARFALHTGDVVEISRVEDEWQDVLNRSQEGYLALPHVVASGNHDTHKTSFNDHFNLPVTNEISRGSYYSFDYNGAHFTILNTNDNIVDEDNPNGAALSDTQLAWLEQDLATARQKGSNWLVVAYHKPLYSSSYHSLQDKDVQAVRERLITILDKYDVDLVLNGHDHVLTTTKPLVANLDAFAAGEVDVTTKTLTDEAGNTYIDTNGTLFVIPNAAGTKMYDDIFNESLEHIKKVRPKLSFMTQENLDAYRQLFDRSSQPSESEKFKTSHSNQRESIVQNFGVYTVTPDELKIDLYQVEGDVLATSEDVLRDAKLVVTYTLVNNRFSLVAKNQELAAQLATDEVKVTSVLSDHKKIGSQVVVPKSEAKANIPSQPIVASHQVGKATVRNAPEPSYLPAKALPKTGDHAASSWLTWLGFGLLVSWFGLLTKKHRD